MHSTDEEREAENNTAPPPARDNSHTLVFIAKNTSFAPGKFNAATAITGNTAIPGWQPKPAGLFP